MIATRDKQLPKGWKWVKLGEICRIFAGSSAPQGKEYFTSTGPCFFRVSDLAQHKRTINLKESQDRLSKLALDTCSLVIARKKSILFPKSGAAIATNNRAMLGVDGYIVSHLMGLEAKITVLPEWVYFAVCQVDMMDYSENIGYPSLKKSIVNKIIIPLPPLSEQKRIVSILEERLAAVEKARQAAEAQLEAIKDLPNVYLRKAFHGEL